MRNWNVFFVLFSCTWLCGTVSALKDAGRDLSTNADGHSRSSGKRSGKHRQCRRRSVTRDPTALEECCRMFVNRPSTDNEGSALAPNSGGSKSQKRRQKRIQKWRAFCELHAGGGGVDNGQASGKGRSSTRRPLVSTTESFENDDDDITDNEYMDEVPKQGGRPTGTQTGQRRTGNDETEGNSDNDRRGFGPNQGGHQSSGRATAGTSRDQNIRDDGASSSGSRVSGPSTWNQRDDGRDSH